MKNLLERNILFAYKLTYDTIPKYALFMIFRRLIWFYIIQQQVTRSL